MCYHFFDYSRKSKRKSLSPSRADDRKMTHEKTEYRVRFEYPNPRKYWSVLKTRLKKSGNELTTRCSQLKMTAEHLKVRKKARF